MGILSKVEFSEWAASTVYMRKKSKEIRVCTDFSTGLNAAFKDYHYPLPRPEEVFNKLNGGKVFSKIDLSEAYLHIPVEENSSKLLCINTIKELRVTLLVIKSEAMNDDFITNIKQKIPAKNERVVIPKKLQNRILRDFHLWHPETNRRIDNRYHFRHVWFRSSPNNTWNMSVREKKEIHRPVDDRPKKKKNITSTFTLRLGRAVLWEPYRSHHNGLFSPLLGLRDFAARGADQHQCYPNSTRLLTFSI